MGCDETATAYPRLSPAATLDLPRAWLALLGYGFQIYFDFSGYSDMAIGLGRLFGIELPQNFNSPYKAMSPRDFWRRWHMTLSFWLRDYIFFPIRRFLLGRQPRLPEWLILAVPPLITMFLSGVCAQWASSSFSVQWRGLTLT